MESGLGNRMNPGSGRYQVPDDLMKRLRAATQQLSSARKHLDTVFDSSNPTVQQKESAQDQIRRAGQELEQVDEKIHTALHA